ncbi:MAG: glycoside hydrolase family 5 protein [Christensenellales bacterium]
MRKKKVRSARGVIFLFVSIMLGLALLVIIGLETISLRREVEALQSTRDSMERLLEEKDGQISALEQKLDAYQNPKGGVKHHGRLSVREGQLVDQKDENVQLRGVSSHGIMWYPQYGNYRSLQTLRGKGVNVFRIAMYTEGRRGYAEQPETATLALRTTLENVLGADMYAIVDWHVLQEENPNVYVEEAVRFFDKISALYGDEPGVIYEICNEPNGDTSWSDIKAYAQRVIPVIRENAPQAIILVGTPSYSTRIEDAAEDPLPFDNLLYAHHFYADMSHGGHEKRIAAARDKGIGVFVSEWGMGSTYDEVKFWELSETCEAFLDYLDENEISWVCWSLSNKEEGHALLKTETQRWSGWSAEELTPYGQFVFDRFGHYEAE